MTREVEIWDDESKATITRTPDGGVRIYADCPGDPYLEFKLSPEEWASLVAGVSAQGAAPERVALVRNFHMYQAPADVDGWDGNGSPTDEFPAPTST